MPDVVNFLVEAPGTLPQYDVDTRWGTSGYNNNCLILAVGYTDDTYERIEVFPVIADVNDEPLPHNDAIYADLEFAIFRTDVTGRNSNLKLAAHSRSGIEYRNLKFGTANGAIYRQDGTLKSPPQADPFAGSYIITDVSGEWTYIQGIGGGILPPYSHDVNIAITTSYADTVFDDSIGILEPGVNVGGSYGGISILCGQIDVVAVNGVPLIEEEYGPTSGPGGGVGGSFDNSSDSVDFASLPSGGAAASGLISMFAPTSAQLASFGQFLWTTLFDGSFDSLLTSLKKWVNDPIESVIQLAAYPVTPPSGAATTLKFCGIRSDLVGSGVTMNKCTSQFMDFDFGQLQTPAYWKQALDYSPYTKVNIYLPYIGICPLAADDVIDATLHLKYHIDLLTGGFSAELKCVKNINGTSLNAVLYNWSGNMATQIPITSSNFSQVFGSMMTAVAAIGVGAITGGMGAAAAGGGAEAAGSAAVAGGALSGAGHGLAANIGNVINSKPHVTQSGRLDGTVGALSQFTPYLIIERPVQSLSSKFQEEQGYPSNIVQRLGDLSGMTVCEAPIMSGFSGATEEEKEAIRAMLCGGVIL